MPIETNEMSKNAKGGTELQAEKLQELIPVELLNEFQIVPSRVRELDETKIRILWCHDLPGDSESDKAFKQIGHNKFHKIVFVSNWQMQQYIMAYDIPWSKCVVLQNAIVPIANHEKPMDKINLIYHTTPHRGLNILVPVFEKLTEKYDNLHLDVYSSFKVYGWDQRDKEYEPLFSKIRENKFATYHGAVDNQTVKEALLKAHIYAYPSIWQETSCISLMEAMSAKVLCIHPNYGALFETAANWTHMYQWQENMNDHAGMLYTVLDDALKIVNLPTTDQRLSTAKGYVDVFYNWELRKLQWEQLLKSLVDLPRAFPKETGNFFSYKV